MTSHLLYALIFLLPGLFAELYYYLFHKKESPNFIRFARVIVYSCFTLLVRILIVLNGGNIYVGVVDLFETIYNTLFYIGLSCILGLLMPNVYILIENLAQKKTDAAQTPASND